MGREMVGRRMVGMSWRRMGMSRRRVEESGRGNGVVRIDNKVRGG